MDGEGRRIAHRLTAELLRGTYNPEWKNNLRKLGFVLRNKLQRKELEYRCDSCGGRLYLAGTHYEKGEKRERRRQGLHLRHCSGGEQKPFCIYAPELHRSRKEIDSDAHRFKRESAEHYMLKTFVKEAIERTLPECTATLEEWIAVAGTRRRPDINVRFDRDGLLPEGSEIAIEVQMSQIMMHDVNRRMEIDGEGRKFTIWILDSYTDGELETNKIYKEDIYEASGLNAFVLDKDAVAATEETGELHLHVWYDTYKTEKGEMAKAETIDKIVAFSELTFEIQGDGTYSVYYYPSLKERERCLEEVAEHKQALSPVEPAKISAPRYCSLDYTEAERLLNTLSDKPGAAVPQFSIGEILLKHPLPEYLILRVCTNPNYIIGSRDIEAAKQRIGELHKKMSTGPLDAEETPAYCIWSAIVFADRIAKAAGNAEHRRRLLTLMREKWNIVKVFQSLHLGKIVGFRFKEMVQFASYIKDNAPGMIPLFLDTAARKNYSLTSNKRNHRAFLENFIREKSITRDRATEQLLRILLPGLFT